MRMISAYMALSHKVMHDMDDRVLSSSGSKQVQSADGLQCRLGHANGAGIQFHLSVVGLVTSLPYAVVLLEERREGVGLGLG